MRKAMLLTSAVMLAMPAAAMAQCQTSLSCSALGYTASSCPNGGLKCPLGDGWWCKPDGSAGDGGSEGDAGCYTILTDCSVISTEQGASSIFYATISCSTYEAQCTSVTNGFCKNPQLLTLIMPTAPITQLSGTSLSEATSKAQSVINSNFEGVILRQSCSKTNPGSGNNSGDSSEDDDSNGSGNVCKGGYGTGSAVYVKKNPNDTYKLTSDYISEQDTLHYSSKVYIADSEECTTAVVVEETVQAKDAAAICSNYVDEYGISGWYLGSHSQLVDITGLRGIGGSYVFPASGCARSSDGRYVKVSGGSTISLSSETGYCNAVCLHSVE